MVRIVRRIGRYEATPIGYSPAWMDWSCHSTVCFPVGIHWIARWIRACWLWTLRADMKERKAYTTGRADGYANGLEEGKRLSIDFAKELLNKYTSEVEPDGREN